MIEEPSVGLRTSVAPAAARAGPVRVMHPCRCDAPDPEESRMEPVDVPAALLLSQGRVIVTCLECEYRVLVVVRPEE